MKSNFKLLLFVFLNTIPFMVGTVIERFRQDKNMAIKVSYNAIINNKYNDLSRIPYNHFASIKKPSELSFSYCISSSPKVLTNEIFANLTNIQYLDTLKINNCGLTKLEPGTFDIFTTLVVLDLNFNNLKSFDAYVNLSGNGDKKPIIVMILNPLEVFPREAIRSLKSSGKQATLLASGYDALTMSKEEFHEIMNSNVTVQLAGIHCICDMKKIAKMDRKRESIHLYATCRFPPNLDGIKTWNLKEKDFDYCNSKTLF